MNSKACWAVASTATDVYSVTATVVYGTFDQYEDALEWSTLRNKLHPETKNIPAPLYQWKPLPGWSKS